MNFTVDTADLRTAAKKFSDLAQEYTSVYTRLLNAASTMGGAWDSDDNLSYVNQINGFCEELKAMTAHLQKSAQSLNQQAGNYETTRENNIAGSKQLAN